MTTVYAERDGTRYTLFANGHATGPVSYTHLTLPTTERV